MEHRAMLVFSHEELIAELESGDSERTAAALYSAVQYDEDWRWVQNQCLKHLTLPNLQVRWAAATCLGDLAFTKRPIEHQRVLISLYESLADSTIADPAQFSISLIKALELVVFTALIVIHDNSGCRE